MTDSQETLKTITAAEGFTETTAPFALFAEWLSDAEKSEINDHNAMSIASVDEDGLPDVRMVLLKDFDENGFVFYTNFNSAKGKELLGQKKAAINFHWKSLRRQVRIRGFVETVSDREADAYFETRARESKIGAWASEQSAPLESRFAFEKRIAKYAAKYAIGTVPRPPYWSGFRVKPITIEFWHDRPFRLHDRIVFTRDDDGQKWQKTRLYP